MRSFHHHVLLALSLAFLTTFIIVNSGVTVEATGRNLLKKNPIVINRDEIQKQIRLHEQQEVASSNSSLPAATVPSDSTDVSFTNAVDEEKTSLGKAKEKKKKKKQGKEDTSDLAHSTATTHDKSRRKTKSSKTASTQILPASSASSSYVQNNIQNKTVATTTLETTINLSSTSSKRNKVPPSQQKCKQKSSALTLEPDVHPANKVSTDIHGLTKPVTDITISQNEIEFQVDVDKKSKSRDVIFLNVDSTSTTTIISSPSSGKSGNKGKSSRRKPKKWLFIVIMSQ